MTDDVDAYYLSRHGMRRKKARKPAMALDSFTTRFLRELNDHRQPAFVERAQGFNPSLKLRPLLGLRFEQALP